LNPHKDSETKYVCVCACRVVNLLFYLYIKKQNFIAVIFQLNISASSLALTMSKSSLVQTEVFISITWSAETFT